MIMSCNWQIISLLLQLIFITFGREEINLCKDFFFKWKKKSKIKLNIHIFKIELLSFFRKHTTNNHKQKDIVNMADILLSKDLAQGAEIPTSSL